jgi:quercetin dioxygenase-like cupin family protein
MSTELHRILDRPLMTFSVPDEISRLKQGEQWTRTRRAALTLAKNADLRLVLVLLSEGMDIHEHQAEGPITVSVAMGALKFSAAGEEHTLDAGALLSLGGGIPHSVHALEECAFIVTVIQPPRAE